MNYEITIDNRIFKRCEFLDGEPVLVKLPETNHSFSFKIKVVQFNYFEHDNNKVNVIVCCEFFNSNKESDFTPVVSLIETELNKQFGLNGEIIRDERIEIRYGDMLIGNSKRLLYFKTNLDVVNKINPYYQWVVLGNSDEN